MKKLFLTSLAFLLLLPVLQAQKVAYVDTEYIMEQIPEYQTIQSEIERVSQQWQDELEQKYQDIEKMYRDYQAEEVLLPDDVKQERQDAIFEAERQAKEYREQKFGYNGELFTLQEAKMKPLQDKIFRATENVAKNKRYDLIFDKAGEVTWLYTNAVYDMSEEVLAEMGYGSDNR